GSTNARSSAPVTSSSGSGLATIGDSLGVSSKKAWQATVSAHAPGLGCQSSEAARKGPWQTTFMTSHPVGDERHGHDLKEAGVGGGGAGRVAGADPAVEAPLARGAGDVVGRAARRGAEAGGGDDVEGAAVGRVDEHAGVAGRPPAGVVE